MKTEIIYTVWNMFDVVAFASEMAVLRTSAFILAGCLGLAVLILVMIERKD